MSEYLYAALVVIGVIALYMTTFLINKNTDSPGEKQKIDPLKCGPCSNYACGIKQQLSKER